jgi:predicted transcriptional regulator
MNINDILAKTKKKSESIVSSRKPPSIASDYRPYDSDHKNSFINPETNKQQITYKPTTEQTTIKKQTNNKPTTEQTEKYVTSNKPETKSETIQETKWKQTSNECESFSISNLVGVQRKIIFIIFEECKNNRSSVTREITIEHVSELTQSSHGTVKVSLQRLEKKGVIIRKNFKVGRGGWSQYELPQYVYNSILMASNWQQTRNKLETQPITEPATNLSSSSSNIKNTTTMTQPELPDEWLEIDISPLSEFNFHQGHLKQLFKHQCELEMVEKSIEYFAFDLTENQKNKTIQTDPINFFMGIMKRAGVYNAPPNYVDPRVKAKKQFLEQQAKQAEDLLMAEKELFEQYFLLWSEKLSKEEREMIIGNDLMSRSSSFQAIKMRDYYRDNFWREHYKKIQHGDG